MKRIGNSFERHDIRQTQNWCTLERGDGRRMTERPSSQRACSKVLGRKTGALLGPSGMSGERT